MTTDSMTLIQAVQQVGEEDLLRQLAEVALAKLMAFEVDGLIGVAKGQHAAERTTYRNGYRDRPLHTRLGTLELRIPKLRQGTYFPSFLEPRRLSERALTAVIQEAWVGGMSTRKVDDLVQALGMTGISKSQVSELCGALDKRVKDFLDRPLTEAYRYVWLDATYLKTRQGGRVVSVAAIIATGVNADGRREGLGLGLGPSEAREFWVEFLRSLVRRGLRGVQLVISDAHEGLKAAIAQVLNAT
jgi:transposase-like protein